MFSNIWADIQNYFSDWLKKTGGIGAYSTFVIDLSVAHDEQKYSFTGNQIIVTKSDSIAYIKLNDPRMDNIDTTMVNLIQTPFNEFFITNEAKTGTLELLVGSKGIFGSIASRIRAVLTDPVDAWGNIHSIGGAELAVRIGSINTYDKRGNVIFMDSFESSTLKWIEFTFGANADVCISTDTAIQGDSCCKLTAGEGVNGIGAILKYIHPQILGRLGAEFSFTIDSDTKTITLTFVVCDGTTNYTHVITYDHKNSKLKYTGSGGTTDIATSFKLEDGFTTFHTMKLVIDSTTHKPIRILINEDIYLLSSYNASTGGASTEPYVEVAITHISDHASVKSIYIDNVIVTQNEP